jgi:hypothetical protein
MKKNEVCGESECHSGEGGGGGWWRRVMVERGVSQHFCEC